MNNPTRNVTAMYSQNILNPLPAHMDKAIVLDLLAFCTSALLTS
jgi:hypothetical protein